MSQRPITQIPLAQMIVNYVDQAEFADNDGPGSLFLMDPRSCICVQMEAV